MAAFALKRSILGEVSQKKQTEPNGLLLLEGEASLLFCFPSATQALV